MKIDRKTWTFESAKKAKSRETAELNKMSYQQKSRLITFLRESYYGRKASTGRVQRIFEVSKLK